MSDGDRRGTSDDLDEPRALDDACADVVRWLDGLTAAIEKQQAVIAGLRHDVHQISRPVPRRRSSTEDGLRAEVARLQAENDRMTADMVDVQGRIAEANAARAKSDMRFAQHRDLAKQAKGHLYGVLPYVVDLWPEIGGHPASRTDELRTQAWTTAQIFRLLFAPDSAAPEMADGWERLADRDPDVSAALAEIRHAAEDLTHRIKAAPGEQRWVWDFSPPGVRFDKALYDSWTQKIVGTVEIVVLPAYFVDTTMVQKPVVLVTGRE
jgi:hypothetical protein